MKEKRRQNKKKESKNVMKEYRNDKNINEAKIKL